ncbi:hypothetical protein EGW08_022730 [Elysia chlorotica]|uniref:Uncharacterized protein n=1 Tax=Elysia chlorotica TaxID=188477 RepID=A0A3S1GZZ5_ELYCH|nr:hypothetical protein EGW08_022730 [Elysia chlorotica]
MDIKGYTVECGKPASNMTPVEEAAMKDKETPKLSRKGSSGNLLRTVSKLMVLDVKIKSKAHQKAASAKSALAKKKASGKGESADTKKGVTFAEETKPPDEDQEQGEDFLPTLEEDETEEGDKSTDDKKDDNEENAVGATEEGVKGEEGAENQQTEGSEDKEKMPEEDEEEKKGGKKGKKKAKTKKDKREEARRRAAAKKEAEQPHSLNVIPPEYPQDFQKTAESGSRVVWLQRSRFSPSVRDVCLSSAALAVSCPLLRRGVA